jgi:hypothetical protein
LALSAGLPVPYGESVSTTGGIVMANPTVDIPYTEQRNRGTVAVRLILAIPHLFIAGAWNYLAAALSVVQWFIVLFTGKRNKGLFDLTNQWLAYATRAFTYTGLMFDTYPAFEFTPDGANTPIRYQATYSESANRLTNGLRIIWAIPAIVIMMVMTVVGTLVTVVCWFAIVFTGNMPRGMFDLLTRIHRFSVQANAYVRLMTDEYPKY